MSNKGNYTDDHSANAMAALEHYATATHTRVVATTSDIDSRDRVMPDMEEWCRARGHLVVLSSGCILSSDPTSRDIQNCKSVLLSKGVRPGKVFAATQNLIAVLLANTADSPIETITADEISERQQYLRGLVQEAINSKASDIHIQVRKTTTLVRLRIHGELRVFAEWSQKLGREIAAVAFNKETDHATAHFNPLIPQDASMPLNINGQEVRLRLASVPAHGGFDMVMRILATGQDKVVTLAELGYTQAQIQLITDAVAYPHGAIIVAGPTGSGKTTTLASCMELIDGSRKLYSIEDPVEKVVEKATQVPVNTDKSDRSFASMGRAALRMDPDVIILGEMRDEDTTRVMVRAAITGHLVLTTVHANSAMGIITRLLDLGASPGLLCDGSVLRLLMFQRLVPKNCTDCRRSIHDSPHHAAILQDLINMQLNTTAVSVKGAGCDTCKYTGIMGRTVVAEVIWVDDKSREFIQRADILGWEHYLKSQGFKSYQQHALDLVEQGVCDPVEIEKTTGKLTQIVTSANFVYH